MFVLRCTSAEAVPGETAARRRAGASRLARPHHPATAPEIVPAQSATPTRDQEASMKSLRICCVVFFAATLVAPCAHAQFGSGIVFDPTQSGHAIVQIEQGEQQIQKWATELEKWEEHLQKEEQIYNTAIQTKNQIVTAYNLAYQMSRMPQNLEARYKAQWSKWTNMSAPDTYGVTSAWMSALDLGGQAQALQAYQNAVVQLQSFPSSSYSSMDSNSQATIQNQYATSQLSQGTTVSTLATLGTIRTDSESFSNQLANLESDTFSDDSELQTEMAVLGKINTATLLQIHSQQDTNQLLAASVQQQLIAQKQQIDSQNRAINNAIYFQQNFSSTQQKVTSGVSDTLRTISLSPSGN
jgi:hypothetical protein